MKKTLPLIVASLFLMQTASYADWMQGIVKKVEGKDITINRTDATQNDSNPRELKVKILDNAKLKNISSLNDLKSGEEVKVDARNNKEQGFWDANYVELINSANQAQDQNQNANPKP
jgi:hypothetical protein